MIVDNTTSINDISDNISVLISNMNDVITYLKNYDDLVIMTRVALFLSIVYILRRLVKGV